MKMGKLIAFEGPDTSGKTTIINKIKAALPIIYTKENFKFTREPGDLIDSNLYNASELIRCELLSNTKLTSLEQAELFAKSRYAHMKNIIKELKEGKNVITDRFLLSSLVYQGIEIGYDTVIEYNKDSLKLLEDNNIEIHNIVLHINKSTYNNRILKKEKDAMELVDKEIIDKRIDFHINKEFLEELSIGKIYQINANKHSEDSVMQALDHIYTILKNN